MTATLSEPSRPAAPAETADDDPLRSGGAKTAPTDAQADIRNRDKDEIQVLPPGITVVSNTSGDRGAPPDGSLTRPFRTIAEGIRHAGPGGVIYLDGGGVYNESFTLLPGQTLCGAVRSSNFEQLLYGSDDKKHRPRIKAEPQQSFRADIQGRRGKAVILLQENNTLNDLVVEVEGPDTAAVAISPSPDDATETTFQLYQCKMTARGERADGLRAAVFGKSRVAKLVLKDNNFGGVNDANGATLLLHGRPARQELARLSDGFVYDFAGRLSETGPSVDAIELLENTCSVVATDPDSPHKTAAQAEPGHALAIHIGGGATVGRLNILGDQHFPGKQERIVSGLVLRLDSAAAVKSVRIANMAGSNQRLSASTSGFKSPAVSVTVRDMARIDNVSVDGADWLTNGESAPAFLLNVERAGQVGTMAITNSNLTTKGRESAALDVRVDHGGVIASLNIVGQTRLTTLKEGSPAVRCSGAGVQRLNITDNVISVNDTADASPALWLPGEASDERAKKFRRRNTFEGAETIRGDSIPPWRDAGTGGYADFREMKKAAENGDATAQFNLGLAHYYGAGVTRDYGEARGWFEKAAQGDDARALWSLGVMFETGKGVARDYAQAARWYRRAADLGLALAQYNLAILYHAGRGVTKLLDEARYWYAQAANQEFEPAVAIMRQLENRD